MSGTKKNVSKSYFEEFLPVQCWEAARMYGSTIRMEFGKKIKSTHYTGSGDLRERELGAFEIIVSVDDWVFYQKENDIFDSEIIDFDNADDLLSILVGERLLGIFYDVDLCEATLEFTGMLSMIIDISDVTDDDFYFSVGISNEEKFWLSKGRGFHLEEE